MKRSTIVTVLVVVAMITSSGCGPKAITKGTLDYFYGLANQEYWQYGTDGLALDDEYGTKQLIINPTGTSDKQQYIVFGDVAVTGSDRRVGPTDAVIKAKVFDGTTEKDVRIRVDEPNLATLQKALSEAFESKTQRDKRLEDVAYAAKLKEADALLAANKVADAIAALKAAQSINDTPEVKTRLDSVYLKQGKYYYSQKSYDVALERLRLVSSDPASIAEASSLISQIAAATAKVAAEKAAAERAAASKEAAERAAVEKATGGWKLIGFKDMIVRDVLVDQRSPNRIFVVEREAYLSTNYGRSWECVSDVNSYAIAMDAFDSQTLYLASYNGMYRSRNGGTTWIGVYVGAKGLRFRSLCVDPNLEGVVYAGVDSVGIVKYTDYATKVDPITLNFVDHYPSNIDLSVPSIAVDPTDSRRLYVGTTYDLYRSSDGGETWNEGAKGTVPNGSFHLISSLAVNAKGVAFASIGSTSWPRPTVDDSGLFRSTDDGQSWSRISAGFAKASTFPSPDIEEICFNPKNSSEMFVATDTGVYHTLDAGKSWKSISAGLSAGGHYVNCLALDPKNPHVLYAGTDEGLYKLAF